VCGKNMKIQKCVSCGSRNIYTTLNEIICRKCGYRKKRKLNKKKEENGK